jgi:2'-5' RNA ligase
MDLVFLTIIPSGEIYHELEETKQKYSTLLRSQRAFRLPPHITLVPPFSTKFYAELVKDLEWTARELRPFRIELDALGVFKDARVVYYNIAGEYIHQVHDALIETTQRHREHRYHERFRAAMSRREKELLAKYGNARVKELYTPHLTLAGSDVDKMAFKELLKKLPEEKHLFYEVKKVQVMRMVDNKWIVDTELVLGENALSGNRTRTTSLEG